MLYTKINQLFYTGILEFATRVAPLTIFLVEIAIVKKRLESNGCFFHVVILSYDPYANK